MTDYTKQEIQMLNDIGNIKAICCVKDVSLWNETDDHMIYEFQITSLSQSAVKQLKKVKLSIFSVYMVPNNHAMDVRLSRRIYP